METFKVGDCVYSEEDFISGEIVEIDGDSALVEFMTPEGGGCLPFKLSELKHEKKDQKSRRLNTIQKNIIDEAYHACMNHRTTEEQELIWRLANAIHCVRTRWMTNDEKAARRILFENDYTVGTD